MKISAGGRDFDVCFITPTWRGDLDRFTLLRESLLAFGHGGVPHYALINTEDEAQLRQMNLPDVVPVTTAGLLSRDAESQRLKYLTMRGGREWKRLQRSLNKRFGWFPVTRYFGWQIQQLIKLQAATQLPHDVFVSFDSDNVITGDFQLENFVPGGKVVVYERRKNLAAGQKQHHWFTNACRLLDVPVPPDYQVDYVNQPVVFERAAMRALHRWLEQRYGRPWYESVLAQKTGAWSEFATYGLFVRHHLNMDGFVSAVTNSENLWISTEEQRRNAPELIRRAFQDPAIKLLVLQSHKRERWPLSRYLPVLREQLAAATARRNLVK